MTLEKFKENVESYFNESFENSMRVSKNLYEFQCEFQRQMDFDWQIFRVLLLKEAEKRFFEEMGETYDSL